MPDAHPLAGSLDRLTIIGAIIAVATVWNTLWAPWRDLAVYINLSVAWTAFIFLGPLVIVLILSMWWVHTH